jgi:serine/threonine-protein kinase
LGKGAMGVVYLAEDTLLNRRAAIKTVELAHDDPAERQFLLDRLMRDARAAAGLSHPNIVAVFDVFEQGDSAYLVLEYIEGETLAEALGRTPVPEPAYTIGILRAMAAALDYTHSRGVVHRDIKPANVMIDRSGVPKIMDFGIARIADTRTTTPTGMVMGTIEYMSPEQVRGETVDGRSDQYALAVLAYRMFSGAPMFGHHSLATLAYKTVNETPPPVCSRNSRLPGAVDVAISKALAKQPGERYGMCGEFVEALAAAFVGTATMPYAAPMGAAAAGTGSAPIAAAAAPAAAPKKNRTGVIVGVAAVVIAAAGAVVFHPWEKAAVAPAEQTAASVAAQPAATEAAKGAAKEPGPASGPTKRFETKALAEAKAPEVKPAAPPVASASSAETPDDLSADGEATEPPHGQVAAPAMAAYRRGQALVKSHDLPGAVAAFSEALMLHPDWPSAIFARARTWQLSGQFAEAVGGFTQYIAARPNGINAYAYRGICHLRLKEDVKALADFEQALTLKPDVAPALYGRGMVRLHRGNNKKAVDDFDDAIRVAPNYELAYQGRANAKRNLGDTRGAEVDLARARQLQGN